jgi:hypothetical protein
VGTGGNHSDRLCELVDRLSKRLVLNPLFLRVIRGAGRRGLRVRAGN